jgi:hypothetical protein
VNVPASPSDEDGGADTPAVAAHLARARRRQARAGLVLGVAVALVVAAYFALRIAGWAGGGGGRLGAPASAAPTPASARGTAPALPPGADATTARGVATAALPRAPESAP